MKKQSSFVKAGAVLAVSGVAVKMLSAAYRIPLTRMLGADVMGRYSAVYSMFMPFFSFATAGISTAVAHFTAQTTSKENSITAGVRSAALQLYMSVGALLLAAYLIFIRLYSVRSQQPVIFWGGLMLAPSILFAVAENVLKGESQGRVDMLPTAQANVLEGFLKTAVGLLGVWCVKQYSTTAKDAKALAVCFMAVTLSGIICTVFLLLRCRYKPAEKAVAAKYRIKPAMLLKMSAPIGVSALAISLANFFDTAVCLPRIAEIPYTAIVSSFDGASFMGAGDIAMYLFGIWQGMVLSVFNLAPAVVASVGSAGLPLISSSWAKKDKSVLERHIRKLFSVTAFLSVPAMAFIFCFGGDIVQLLFATTSNQTKIAAVLLKIICTGGIMCCFTSAFNSVLFAAGKSSRVFAILLSACAVKIVASFVLCGVPSVNIRAFAVSNVCFYTIIFVRSVTAVKKLGASFEFAHIFGVPFVASTVAVLLANWLKATQLYSLPLFIRLFFCGVIFALIYLLIVICTGFFVDK